MGRLFWTIGGLFLVVLGSAAFWTRARPASLPASYAEGWLSPLAQKPVHNWRVCQDLGVGPVPGLSEPRLRLRLCHNRGWEVLTYCLQPQRPAPSIGTRCSRVSANTYWCGTGFQNLREYAVEQTPTATPTATFTPTSTSTPIPTSTPTSTASPPPPTLTPPAPTTVPPLATRTAAPPRARPGGKGNFDWRVLARLFHHALDAHAPFLPQKATPTPFQPLQPTAAEVEVEHGNPLNFYGVDFSKWDKRTYIYVYPPGGRRTRPIVISFLPGATCEYGDQRACVNAYFTAQGGQVIHLSVHSGVEGEAEAFRRWVEGLGMNRAAFTLKQIQNRLRALEGAEVVIVQGKKRVEGFTLVATVRIPPRRINAYFDYPVEQALSYAATLDSRLREYAQAGLPLLVFETCGWKVPGEAWIKGITSTSASAYLGLIQKKP